MLIPVFSFSGLVAQSHESGIVCQSLRDCQRTAGLEMTPGEFF
jgi:hypothetical protein